MSDISPPVSNPPLRLLVSLHDYVEGDPDWLLTVPGREMWVAAQTTRKRHHQVILPDWTAALKFDAVGIRRRQRLSGLPVPHRMRYLGAAARLLLDDGLAVPGLLAVIVGNEPPGPRYEYSLGLALLALWHTAAGKIGDATALMTLMERIEREYL